MSWVLYGCESHVMEVCKRHNTVITMATSINNVNTKLHFGANIPASVALSIAINWMESLKVDHKISVF